MQEKDPDICLLVQTADHVHNDKFETSYDNIYRKCS